MRKNLFLVSIIASFAFIFMGCPQPIVELNSIAITKAATKVEYEIGEKLDTTGMEVTAKYSDGTEKVVTGWKTSGFDSSKAAEKQTVTVSYTENEITKTASFSVKIKAAPAEEENEQTPEETPKEEKPAENPEDKTPADETTDDDANTVYKELAVKVDDTWRVVLLNTSKSKYKVISHDENSIVIDILEDVNEQIHVEYKFKEIDLTEYKEISYNIKADSTGSMKVGYWTDEDFGSNSESSYSPEGVNSSFPTIKQTDKSGVLYFVTNKAGRYEFSNIAATVYELPSTSKEGRLSLEAVEGGIKVTVRLLDSDEVPSNYNNFDIKERKTGICLLLEKPSSTSKEVSGVYPFVKENEQYEFEFLLQTASIPWHTEVAGCKATSTGLNPDEYFDFDYAPASAKRILNDEGYLSIDKDVKKFFKHIPASLYMDGGIFAGCSEPWNADWVSAWHSKLINYDNDNWKIDVDYDKLISTKGFDLGSVLKADSSKLAKLKSKDTWFVQGDIYFTVDNCDMEFKINFKKDDDASTDIFKAVKTLVDYLPITGKETDLQQLPASLGENPFAGKYYKIVDDNYHGEYSYKFNADGTGEVFQNGKKDQCRYSWNTETKMLYIQNFIINNLEYESAYAMLSALGDYEKYYAYIAFNTIEEYHFSFNESGDLKIIPSAVSSENIEKFLTGAIGNLGEFTDEEYYCSSAEIGNIRWGEGSSYVNLAVEDGNIVCGVLDDRGSNFATFIKIPYSYNEADNTLTLTIDGSQHVLSFEKPVIRSHGDYYDINDWKLITE